MTDYDFDSALASWDWFNMAQFCLPDNLKLVTEFDEIHQSARLEALRRPCHNRTKGAKKKFQSSAEEMKMRIRKLLYRRGQR
jgi:hypothetical protein